MSCNLVFALLLAARNSSLIFCLILQQHIAMNLYHIMFVLVFDYVYCLDSIIATPYKEVPEVYGYACVSCDFVIS